MDPDEFVKLSAKLVGMGRPGARSAVSRAYYGSFHKAVKMLAEVASVPPGSQKSHVISVEYLKSCGHSDGIKAGRLLGDLHADRLKSDYRLDDAAVETMQFAMIAVESAAEFGRLLDAFRRSCESDETVLQRLKAGIAAVNGSRRI